MSVPSMLATSFAIYTEEQERKYRQHLLYLLAGRVFRALPYRSLVLFLGKATSQECEKNLACFFIFMYQKICSFKSNIVVIEESDVQWGRSSSG